MGAHVRAHHARKGFRMSADAATALAGFLAVLALGAGAATLSDTMAVADDEATEPIEWQATHDEVMAQTYASLKADMPANRAADMWAEYDCSTFAEYMDHVHAKNEEAIGLAENAIDAFGKYMGDGQDDRLYELEAIMTSTQSMARYDEAETESADIINAAAEKAAAARAASVSSAAVGNLPSGVLSKAGGVNQFNGHTETWYSSNRLYHYRTSEWTVDANGVYRDADGYVVVASPYGADGSLIETSHGTGKAYDYCPGGTVDIYTNW